MGVQRIRNKGRELPIIILGRGGGGGGAIFNSKARAMSNVGWEQGKQMEPLVAGPLGTNQVQERLLTR